VATILIVDDLPANRDVLVSLLRYAGHRLLEARDGREALAVVQAERPELVITDVLMPVMDGYEFVRQLREDPDTRFVPVIFYTAHYGEHEARALALENGVSHVLVKPTEPQDVLDVVARVLAGEVSPVSLRESRAVAGPAEFDRDHLRLVTDKLSQKTEDLRIANAHLRALVNIGLELASERDSDQLLVKVCHAARELFGATYVSLGIIDRRGMTVRRVVACGNVSAERWKEGAAVAGILGSVITERRTLRGVNGHGDPTSLGMPADHPEVRAYLIAPIASPAHAYGWLALVGNEGREFGDEDEQLAVALSGQVGRIYENGYFYRVAEKRAEQLEREVMERMQGEAALRQERDRAQRYLNTAEAILLALDLDGRVTLVNRYACSVLGWAAEDLIGRDWVETCLPPRIRPALKQKFRRLVAGDVSLGEHPILTRAGEERLIEWRDTVVSDETGTVVGTFSSGTDVTDRVRAVEALRTAEERMRFALKSADVGIWDLDYTTGVLRWSETLERHYGLSPGTFAGTFDAFVACVHPEDRALTTETIGKAMREGSDFWVHHRAVWPDGTIRWISGAGRILLDAGGGPVRGVGISLDVTDRRNLEAQYQQAQKMEAVGRLAGGVAHDFNNLLTAILGYCELLREDLGPDDPRQGDLAEIQKAGASAASLTRQLLAFSRKQIIEPSLIDLNEVVRDMDAMLRRLIGEDVTVVLALGSDLSRVVADRGQIEQIILNLAVNARDAMPKGGTLTIGTANVELDEHYERTHFSVRPGPYVGLTVSDTGTGMSPEVQARLFEPFFTTKEPGKGTGLGLATVHGIVARSGGSVNVYSEPGFGTAFTIYLPKAEADATASAIRVPASRQVTRGQTILVVDDAEGLRELARRFLRRLGYNVLVAANGMEARRIFESQPSIDVILTDVVMPGASGPELTRQLIEMQPALKVIYMSGYTEEAIVHHGVLNPGIAFLHKPFTSESLDRKLREVLAESPGPRR